MTPQRTGSLNKSARLIVLQKLLDDGKAGNKEQVARLFGVSRFTIYRDYKDLEKLQPMVKELLKKATQS